MLKKRVLSFLIFCSFLIFSCTSNNINPPINNNEQELSLATNSLSLKVGNSIAFPLKNYIATNDALSFYSDDINVATIDSSGLITAINEGIAFVYVENNNGETASISLKVYEDAKEESSLWDYSQDYLRTGQKVFDFYNFNDFHGACEFNDDNSEPGINKLATYINDLKNKNYENFILTSSGDMWQGSADSNISKGSLVIDWMNYLNFDAQTIGNHEFDWGIDYILHNEERMNFPLLACNIYDENNLEYIDTWVKPYTTITRNGLHIGIVGAIGEGQTSDICSKYVENLSFVNPDALVKKWAKYLKDNGADIVLYLLHNSIYSIQDYTLFANVDLLFGGHTHTGEKESIYNVPAIQAYCNGKDVGHINLTYDFDSDSILKYGDYDYIDTRSFKLKYIADDAYFSNLYNRYLKYQINDIKNKVVSNYTGEISKLNAAYLYNQYAYQYYIDNEKEKYPIFAVETNNARSDIVGSSGGITYGQIYKAFPFDNYLTLIKIKGDDIINSLSTYSSSHFYVIDSRLNVNNYQINDYVFSENYYYILTIDYIATSSFYDQAFEIIKIYDDETALPRNIVSKYLIDYPNNFVG